MIVRRLRDVVLNVQFKHQLESFLDILYRYKTKYSINVFYLDLDIISQTQG